MRTCLNLNGWVLDHVGWLLCLSLSDAFSLKTDQSPKSLDLKTSPFILHIPGWCIIIASGGGESVGASTTFVF